MASFSLEFSSHAVERMLQRKISSEDVRRVVISGTEIPGGSPAPRRLLFAFSGGRPIHVVLDDLSIDGKILIITVYEPDPEMWGENFTRRRDSFDEMRDLQSGGNPSRHNDHDS